MKKILLSTGVAILAYATNINAQMAYFTGADDWNWHNPADWNWEGGSGTLPDENTEVILLAGPEVSPGQIAVAKDISASSDAGLIVLYNDATLKVSGNLTNVQIATMDLMSESYSANASLVFNGTSDQIITTSNILAGDLVIEKNSGNVFTPFSMVFVLDTLKLLSAPKPIGEASVGNLIVQTGNLMLNAQGGVLMSEFNSSQIPPHIVVNQIGFWESGMALVWSGSFGPDFSPTGLDGTVFFPIGHSTESYTPITITQEGAESNLWSVYMYDIPGYDCNDNINYDQSLSYSWMISPVQLVEDEDEGLIPEVLESVTNPATVSISFNQSNIGLEVPEGYNASLNRRLFVRNSSVCDLDGDIEMSGTPMVTITKTGATQFGEWSFAYDATLSANNHVNNLNLNIYPNPTQNTIYLEMPAPNSDVHVVVSDIQGREMMAQTFAASQFVAPVALDVQQLGNGTYILHVSSKEGISVKKVVVQR